MKLRRSGKSESFYEAFSDLIFTTMAIFILLFIVIMTEVNARPKPQKAIDLVVAIDMSGSMGDPLRELVRVLRDLSENFPNIIRDFRVGVVAYNLVLEGGAKIYPLATMDEAGISSLHEFLKDVEPRGGSVDVKMGLEFALKQFGEDGAERRRSLVLIGDVGPYEAENGVQSQTYSPMLNAAWQLVQQGLPPRFDYDRAYEESTIALAKEFAARSPEHRVLTVYTGKNDDSLREVGIIHEQFFCNFAGVVGTQGKYVDSYNRLVWELMETFLAEPGKEIVESPDEAPCPEINVGSGG